MNKQISLTKLLTITMILISSFMSSSEAQPQKRTGGRKVTSPSKSLTKASLSIEAGLIYASGDVKPVARTNFLLLNREPGIILKDAGIKYPSAGNTPEPFLEELNNPKSLLVALNGSMVGSRYGNPQFLEKARLALKPHIVQSVTTDFSGKAVFSSIPAGTYYLYGVYRSPGDPSSLGYFPHYWNMEVTISKDPVSLVLDNNNAQGGSI